jgi:hypothetical protein
MRPALDGTLLFLNAVADWSESRHVAIRIWRTDAPAAGDYATPIRDWCVTVTLRDSEGLFHGTICARRPVRGESDEKFSRTVWAELDRCCAETRRKRIQDFNHADPRRVQQSAGAEVKAGSSMEESHDQTNHT